MIGFAHRCAVPCTDAETDDAEPQEVCAICLTDATSSGAFAMKCCSRRLHQSCWDAYVNSSLDTRCPYCRTAVRMDSGVECALAARRKARNEAQENEAQRSLRRRHDVAQQLYDVYAALSTSRPDPE